MLNIVTYRRGGAAIRATGLLLASVLSGLLAGCGSPSPDGYEPHLRYAARTDPVVLAPPAEQPTAAPDPLKLEEYLAGSAGRGAKVLGLRDTGGGVGGSSFIVGFWLEGDCRFSTGDSGNGSVPS